MDQIKLVNEIPLTIKEHKMKINNPPLTMKTQTPIYYEIKTMVQSSQMT